MPEHVWIVVAKHYPVAAFTDVAEAADAFSTYGPGQVAMVRVPLDDLVLPDKSRPAASFTVGFEDGEAVDLAHAAVRAPTDGNRWGDRGYATVVADNAHDALAKATVLFDALGICQLA